MPEATRQDRTGQDRTGEDRPLCSSHTLKHLEPQLQWLPGQQGTIPADHDLGHKSMIDLSIYGIFKCSVLTCYSAAGEQDRRLLQLQPEKTGIQFVH